MNPQLPTELVSMKDLIIVAPMAAMFLISLIPLMLKPFLGNREPNPFTVLVYNFLGILVAAGLTASFFGHSFGGKTFAFSNAIVLDGMTVWMSYLVYIVTGVGLMLAYEHVATRGRQFTEFCFLMVSSAAGMLVLIMSNDLIVTFIGIETMSLCLYILVAMSREQVLSKEAAFKYFVLGSFASAIFLYGVALTYGTVGSTYLPDIAAAGVKLITTNRMFLVGAIMILVGFAFKVSIFPFHAWTPDVYQGAATPVTAFMSTAVKAATFVAFLRFFTSEAFAMSPHLLSVMTWLAVLTMTIGNVAALMQNNFKRILAYSSVAHSGYAMVGLITAGFGTNYNAAATSLLFYLFSYTLMTLGTFALVCVFEKNENTSLEVQDLRGIGRRYPWLAMSLTVLMLSLAGIPPTLGFFGKFFVFSAAIEQDMYWLAFWGMLNSVISVYYYLRPIVVMYMSEEESGEVITAQLMTRGTVIVTALLIVVLGLLASPLFRMVQHSVMNQF
jgi:NADH-quinone oxidoreductase subunit N